MAYRNGTYIAFDGQGKTDPTQSDLKYLGLLRSWDKNSNFDFHFIDSHKKTAAVLDSSLRKTLENRLMERMRNSKNILLVLPGETNYNRGLLNFEIEKAVDLYELPLIIAYTDCSHVINYDDYSIRWPKVLVDRVNDGSANAIHIPFKKKAIIEALNRFSVNSTGSDILRGPDNVFSKEAYAQWGYYFS